MTLAAWNLAIDRFIDTDVPAELLKMQRLLSIAALNGVVLKSPVDTGRFRGAWIVTINQPSAAAPGTTYGEKGSGAGAAAAVAINAGLGVIKSAEPFSNIIIQNNVEYGEDLEGGSSTQAPGGMVAVTVAELEAISA